MYPTFSSDEVALVQQFRMVHNNILGDSKIEFKDRRVKARLQIFKEYTLFMKYLCVKWEIKSLKNQIRSSFSPNTTSVNTLTNGLKPDFNNTAEGYDAKNTFFNDNGYFFPQFVSKPYSSFVKENMHLLNIVPTAVGSIDICHHIPDIVSCAKKEFVIESELFSLLNVAGELFKNNKFIFKRQETQYIKDTDYKSIPDISITINKLDTVPVEIKCNKIKEKFQSFDLSKSKTNNESKQFINLFSQGFMQSLSCNSNTFIITDGSYCIGFILNHYPSISYNMSKLYRIPCEIVIFDAEHEQVSVPTFILLFTLKFSKTVEESRVSDFVTSLSYTKDQTSQLWKDRYETLYSFYELISSVPNNIKVNIQTQDVLTSAISGEHNNNLDSSATEFGVGSSDDGDSDIHTINEYIQGALEVIYNYPEDTEADMQDTMEDDLEDDIEDDKMTNNSSVRFQDSDIKQIKEVEIKIFQKFDINMSLIGYCVLKNIMNMELLDISSIGSYTILSGKLPQKNYSIVIKTGDDKIYKIFDPILCKVDESSTVVYFEDRLKQSFKYFIRESLVNVLLNKTKFKPKCYSIGFLKNQEAKTCSDIGSVNSMSGFYIKMQHVKGEVLSKSNFNSKAEVELYNVMKTLHGLGVSHGDVHASNFLYDTGTNSMMILDFGRSYQAYLRGNAGFKKKGTYISELEKRIKFDNENTKSMIHKLVHGPRSCYPFS
ncbi:hypothetical protein DFJ63DRAFT_183811 [Scheffersomyces coipomensis]|uniref:uncharacterized protein n=1 Tax=Scheffersomyces coipomensis TaxID=1788519 RepID=UPI00315DE95C